jgi:hypothetical protein
MKKIISALVLLVLASVSFGSVAKAQVAIGSRSEEVKMIQEILKTDPSVYPQGLVTGYYGSLTQEAVKKLQRRCGLPETGVIDSATEKCIYPIDYKAKITYPNGGEVLDRNTIYTARWEVTQPEVSIPERPLWTKASLDLFKRIKNCASCPVGSTDCGCATTSVFVRHIATVNLLDQAYSGRITNDIPNSKDYVIRITWGEDIVPIWYNEKNNLALPSATDIWPIQPIPTNWDESDGTFEITGTITPFCPDCPICPTNPDLGKVITILQNMIIELQNAIALLKS